MLSTFHTVSCNPHISFGEKHQPQFMEKGKGKLESSKREQLSSSFLNCHWHVNSLIFSFLARQVAYH
jgi:hypothetical protein